MNITPFQLNYPNWKSILLNGDIVGVEISNYGASSYDFVVLTMQRKILSPGESKRLAQAANLLGKKVVLVPSLDVIREPEYMPASNQKYMLDVIANHTQDDIATAVLAGRGAFTSTVDYVYAAIAYTYNQIIHDKKWHAESIMAEFLRVIDCKEKKLWWLMLLEPCHDCLSNMVNAKADVIAYFEHHKEKWNTQEYLELKHRLMWLGTPIYVKEVIVK